MIKRNSIVYFEEDDTERITGGYWGKILDMTPRVNVHGYVECIDLETEKMNPFNGDGFGRYYIGYQKSFKVRLQDGQEFEFKGTDGEIQNDMEFNEEFLRFVEDFHNGKYEPCSKLQVTSEVEFMDI